MNKVANITADVLQKVGDRFARRLSNDDQHTYEYVQRSSSGSGLMFPSAGSAFHRPLDRKNEKHKVYSSKHRGVVYGSGGKKYSSDNLVASPPYSSSFQNYRQQSSHDGYINGVERPPYGTGIGGPLGYPYGSSSGVNSSYSGFGMPYGVFPGSVGYAPDYYISERRQVELVPAPPPRVVPQPYPVPFPVDRPVPQPYPVEVIRPIPVDRPVPVPVPSPVPVPIDRPVPVPVPVPVPSPPPPPVCVPVPVPTPYACYVPVGVPVPSPPASPVMFEQSFSHQQRWVAGSPVMGMNPYLSYSASFIR